MSIAIDLMKCAGRIIERPFFQFERLNIEEHGRFHFSTNLNQRIQEILTKGIQQTYPTHQIMIHENLIYAQKESEINWVIHPMSGTHNFINRIPYVAIVIGIQTKNVQHVWQTTHAIIYNPISGDGDLCTAEQGQGAQFNNRRMKISTNSLNRSLMCCMHQPREFKEFQAYQNICYPIYQNLLGCRKFGSSALEFAYLASGKLHILLYQSSSYYKDIGELIIKESGGIIAPTAITNLHIAAHHQLHAAIKHLIR